MNLLKRKKLIARVLNIGKGRVKLDTEFEKEIGEAITRQDIRDLLKDKAIIIKEEKGRLTRKKRKTRRMQGSRKKNLRGRKRHYIVMVRKLRAHIKSLRKAGKITKVEYKNLNQKIKARVFKDISHLRDAIRGGSK